MYDATPFAVISLFEFLVAGTIFLYLLRPGLSQLRERPYSASSFVFGAVLVLGLAGMLLFLFKVANPLLAFGISLGLAVSLVSPAAAVCFLIANLFLRPWELLPDNTFLALLPRLLAAITFFSWLVHSVLNRHSRVVWNLPCLLFVLFLGWLLLSSLFSPVAHNSLSFFFDNFLPIAVVSLLILNAFSKTRELGLLVRTLVLSVVGVMCVALSITLREYVLLSGELRLHSVGLWGNANDLAALAILILPLTLAPFLTKELPRRSSVSALLLSSVLLVGILFSQSRGALIALAVAVLSYFAFCTKTTKSKLLIGLITVSVPLLLYLGLQREVEDLSGSTESRTNYLIAGMRMVKDHMLFGIGLNNYQNVYDQYTPAFLEWGSRTAHSSWVLVLAESGIIGLVLFGSLYLSTVTYAWRIRRQEPQFLLAILGYGVVMSFLSHTYLFLPYVLMALVLAAARTYSNRTKTRWSALNPICASFLLLVSATTVSAQEVTRLEGCAGADKPIAMIDPETTRQITLRGSREETLLFLLKATGAGCSSVTLDFPKQIARSIKFSLNSLPAVTTTHPSFPGAFVGAHLDPVIPISLQSVCLRPGADNWLLGELKIDSNAAPGTHQATLSLGQASIPIQLVIWKMTIPKRPSLPAYAEMTPWFAVLGHYGKWHADESILAQRYADAMVKHRIYPLKSTIAPLEIVGEGLETFLEIQQKPSPQSSFSAVVLNARPDWAYFDFPTVGSSGFERIDYRKAESYFRAVENTINKINRPSQALVYLWDEPKTEMMGELVQLSKLAKLHAPSLKQLVTVTFQAPLEKSVDIFAPVINYFDAADHPRPQVYRGLQSRGHEVWWYVSCMSHGCEALADTSVPDMVLDRPAVYVRSIGWLSLKYGIDAFLYYSVNNGYQFNPKRDPWKSLWDFSGNGDGTLFYPGRPGEHGLSEHTPIPSLRLKLWRESSFDADYIRWMEELPRQPKWWKSEFARLVRSTTEWSHSYRQYQELRDKAGEYLNTNLIG